RASVSKSGKPCAKLTAFCGPCIARFRRVISRMTDSVKLWAFRETSPAALVSGIGALQPQVDARAGVAARRTLQASLPPAAHVARPARLGEEVEHIGAAQQADHLAPANYRHAPDALADQKTRGLVDASLLGHGDDTLAH